MANAYQVTIRFLQIALIIYFFKAAYNWLYQQQTFGAHDFVLWISERQTDFTFYHCKYSYKWVFCSLDDYLSTIYFYAPVSKLGIILVLHQWWVADCIQENNVPSITQIVKIGSSWNLEKLFVGIIKLQRLITRQIAWCSSELWPLNYKKKAIAPCLLAYFNI